MMEWWMWVLVASWPITGILVWIVFVMRNRLIDVGDIIAFPVCALLGWAVVLVAVIDVLRRINTDRVLFRW